MGLGGHGPDEARRMHEARIDWDGARVDGERGTSALICLLARLLACWLLTDGKGWAAETHYDRSE